MELAAGYNETLQSLIEAEIRRSDNDQFFYYVHELFEILALLREARDNDNN